MKALVYHGNKDLRVEEILEPETQPGQVKLAVDFCGICATDIEEYLYGPVFISGDAPNPVTGKMMPLVTGHEITGTVIEIAPGVEHLNRRPRSPQRRFDLREVLLAQVRRNNSMP